METDYFTVRPETPVTEAIKAFREATRKLERRVFGMVVVNAEGELVGMISMYDILVLMRPKHIQIWGEMNDINFTGFINEILERAKSILVGDLMTTEVIAVTPDTNLLLIVDIMTRKHIRRIPVIEDGKVIGIVHISNVFFYLMERDPHATMDGVSPEKGVPHDERRTEIHAEPTAGAPGYAKDCHEHPGRNDNRGGSPVLHKK
jgi:CBS domain-containing protein